MQTISLKMEDNLLKEVDLRLSKNRYTTRTEFIRDAIRQKLSDLEKDEILRKLSKMKGISNRESSDEKIHSAREKAFDFIEKKLKS
ncbi:MAG: ribbon-helix-helix domain-containing protein [Candidatus Woesearchaeota archaeon]